MIDVRAPAREYAALPSHQIDAGICNDCILGLLDMQRQDGRGMPHNALCSSRAGDRNGIYLCSYLDSGAWYECELCAAFLLFGSVLFGCSLVVEVLVLRSGTERICDLSIPGRKETWN